MFDGRSNDGVSRIEVAVGEMVAHAGYVDPGDRGFTSKQFGIDGLDGLTHLDETGRHDPCERGEER